jgi:hypothetical protein
MYEQENEKKIDFKLIKAKCEGLILEHRKLNCDDSIDYKIDRETAIDASKITVNKLAQETGKKIYYLMLNYLIKL